MTYRYNQAAAAVDAPANPTYKGKSLKHVGGDTWVLEGHGATVSANFKHGGWEVSLTMADRRVLPGTVHGKDLETVIDSVIKNEHSAIDGGKMRLDMAKKSLDSLGK